MPLDPEPRGDGGGVRLGGGRRGTYRRHRLARVALQFKPGEPPTLGPALQRDDLVRHTGVDQRLRADDAARAPGAGDDDQRVPVRHEIGEAIDQLRARAGLRARHVKAVEFLDRAAVEHDMLGAVAAHPVELGGGDMRRVAGDLDEFGESLARHVAARKQRVARHRPRRDTAGQAVDIVIAERGEPSRRLVGDAVIAVEEDDPGRFARHQPQDFELEPAIGQIDREQRMAVAMRPLLAQIEKSDLLAVAEPASRGRDVYRLGLSHVALPKMHYGVAPMRVSSTKRSVAASIALPARPRGAWI